jgi:hypothetical protein
MNIYYPCISQRIKFILLKAQLRKAVILLIFSIVLICCNKDNTELNNDNLSLLTNNSSKIWIISNITFESELNIKPFECNLDDEHKFNKDGNYYKDNKGTDIDSIFLSGPPSTCIDTINIITQGKWSFSSKKDSLIVIGKYYFLVGKILKLTKDSLVLKRTFDGFSQIEYYITKK